MKRIIIAVTVVLPCLMIGYPAWLAVDHSIMVKGPFNKVPNVTKACLQCH